METCTMKHEGFPPRSLRTPTAHRLSFPTCLSHPRIIHLHCHQDSPLAANLPSLGFSNRMDRKSLSSVAATGLLLGFLTSSAHSLTWRESLKDWVTCLFNNNHLPHTGQQATRSPALRGHNSQLGKWVWTPETKTISAKV